MITDDNEPQPNATQDASPADDRLMTDKQVAEKFRVSEGFVRNGGLNLPFIKIGRLKRTRESDVRRLIEERTVTKRRVRCPDGTVEEINLVTGARTPVQKVQS